MLSLFCLAVRLDSQPSQGRTLRNLPESIPELMECQEPPKTPKNPVYPNFRLYDKDELPTVVRWKEFAWMLGRSLSSLSHQETQEPEDLCNATQVPVWSAYNSFIYDPLDTTRTATPPHIASPAHEWSTLLTVLKLILQRILRKRKIGMLESLQQSWWRCNYCSRKPWNNRTPRWRYHKGSWEVCLPSIPAKYKHEWAKVVVI